MVKDRIEEKERVFKKLQFIGSNAGTTTPN
jgi:hypothetical protein